MTDRGLLDGAIAVEQFDGCRRRRGRTPEAADARARALARRPGVPRARTAPRAAGGDGGHGLGEARPRPGSAPDPLVRRSCEAAAREGRLRHVLRVARRRGRRPRRSAAAAGRLPRVGRRRARRLRRLRPRGPSLDVRLHEPPRHVPGVVPGGWAAPLRSPPALVAFDADKRYLAALSAPSVPTPSSRRGTTSALDGEVVVEPNVSAGARDTGRFGRSLHADQRSRWCSAST